VKQNVSAPVAAIIIALVILGSIALFSRPRFGKANPGEAFVLPSAPPVDEDRMKLLYQGLAPLGIACVMPPLAPDRLKGARVALVARGAPADRGGIKPGDLITRFGDVKVTNPYAIIAALMRADPKKPSTVTVVRAGKEQKLTITGLTPPLSAQMAR
jgi:hypothetical protein